MTCHWAGFLNSFFGQPHLSWRPKWQSCLFSLQILAACTCLPCRRHGNFDYPQPCLPWQVVRPSRSAASCRLRRPGLTCAERSEVAESLPSSSFCAKRSGVAESLPSSSFCAERSGVAESLPSSSFCAERSGVAESLLSSSFCAERSGVAESLLSSSFCAERSGVAESFPSSSFCAERSGVAESHPSSSFCAERSGVAESLRMILTFPNTKKTPGRSRGFWLRAAKPPGF